MVTTSKNLMQYRMSDGRTLIAQRIGRSWSVYVTGRHVLDAPTYVERDITKAQARGWFYDLMLADLRATVSDIPDDDDYFVLEDPEVEESAALILGTAAPREALMLEDVE